MEQTKNNKSATAAKQAGYLIVSKVDLEVIARAIAKDGYSSVSIPVEVIQGRDVAGRVQVSIDYTEIVRRGYDIRGVDLTGEKQALRDFYNLSTNREQCVKTICEHWPEHAEMIRAYHESRSNPIRITLPDRHSVGGHRSTCEESVSSSE